jgi:hypothetical protein
VPVRLHVMRASPTLQGVVRREGWPWIGVLAEDGSSVRSFPGVQGPAELIGHMDKALEQAPPAVVEWEALGKLVARLVAARESEETGWPGDAYDEYLALLRESLPVTLRDGAKRGLKRVGQRARKALLGAQTLAAGEAGLDAASEALRTEVEAFEGSPFADELRAVLAHVERYRTFPRLRRVEGE